MYLLFTCILICYTAVYYIHYTPTYIRSLILCISTGAVSSPQPLDGPSGQAYTHPHWFVGRVTLRYDICILGCIYMYSVCIWHIFYNVLSMYI